MRVWSLACLLLAEGGTVSRKMCIVPMQIGHILYSGIMPWLVYDGAAGDMLAPVIFAMLILVGAVLILAIFVGTQASTLPVYQCKLALSEGVTQIL